MLWLAVLVLVAAGGLWMFRTSQTHAQPSAGKGATEGGQQSNSKGGRGGRGGGPQVTPVAAVKAYRGDIPVYLQGLGSVNAFYTVTVRSRVDGQLMNVFVREGEYVKQGQLLAQIDPRPFQVQLAQAQGTLARDQASLANARTDLSRYQTLIQQEAIPKQQLDTQGATVAQFEGTVKQDQASVDNANLQLTYARITAPIGGRIGLRQVDPGNIVHASDANGILVITQLQPIAVLFTIPEDNLPPVLKKLRAGAKLRAEAFNRDFSMKLGTGTLLTLDNTIDAQTGTSKLKAVFDNHEGVLFPNQFVNVRLLVDTERNQVIIPLVAIQRGQQGTYVYVVKQDSSVEVRQITQGIAVGDIVSIRKGLNPGEVVVTDGTDKLQPGSKVRARQAKEKGAENSDETDSGGGPPA